MKIVHVDDVVPERMQRADGWAISEFRLPVTGADGSSTTMFHAIFRPGSVHDKHVHLNADEIVAYLGGRGTVGQGSGRAEVLGGYRRWIPKGSEHFFFNESESEVGLVVGFYPNADGLADTGYEHRGTVAPLDVERPLPPPTEGTLVRVDDVPERVAGRPPGWEQLGICVSVGRDTGVPNALVDIAIPPGGEIPRHRMNGCEQIYFVASGAGSVETAEGSTPVRDGHIVFATVGTVLAIRNTSLEEPMTLVGMWTGAGNLAEARCEPA